MRHSSVFTVFETGGATMPHMNNQRMHAEQPSLQQHCLRCSAPCGNRKHIQGTGLQHPKICDWWWQRYNKLINAWTGRVSVKTEAGWGLCLANHERGYVSDKLWCAVLQFVVYDCVLLRLPPSQFKATWVDMIGGFHSIILNSITMCLYWVTFWTIDWKQYGTVNTRYILKGCAKISSFFNACQSSWNNLEIQTLFYDAAFMA